MRLIVNDQISIHRGILFKYKALDGVNLEYTLDILRDSEIYCPRPSKLNDPEECKPDLVIGDLMDPAYWRRIEAWVRRVVAHRDPLPTEDEIQAELAQLTPEKLSEMAGATAGQYHEAVDARYRILSMALSPINGHLWSAYAAEYTGVCIAFDIHPMIATAYRVSYSDDVPLLDLVDDDGFAALDMTGLRKRKKWEPEGEARFIVSEPALEGDEPLVNQKLPFWPSSIKALIFGYRIEADKKRQLIAAVRGRGIPLIMATGGPPFNRVELQQFGVA